MACINPDGTLTPSAQSVLAALRTPATVTEVASATGLPLYRIRSSLRELIEAGLLNESEGKYQLTEAGDKRLKEAEAKV